ncbi:hypothetical protein EV356DRAFT_534985 [Viridothelium virens]|uniref:Uncharacterized protein n=1 Tax=Viridothelium virens TaxID=1048519 RepID=A0A6A6H1N0_VIRVR|nr:hypothetical protein EV356DRAFT_534985 [Viridothelium virens]
MSREASTVVDAPDTQASGNAQLTYGNSVDRSQRNSNVIVNSLEMVAGDLPTAEALENHASGKHQRTRRNTLTKFRDNPVLLLISLAILLIIVVALVLGIVVPMELFRGSNAQGQKNISTPSISATFHPSNATTGAGFNTSSQLPPGLTTSWLPTASTDGAAPLTSPFTPYMTTSYTKGCAGCTSVDSVRRLAI